MNWQAVQSTPAFGFTVVGLVIVFGALVAERPRLPRLLGLLTFGAVIGPNMLDLLPRFTGLQAVGSIGVLYPIFLAGLQLDLEAFVRYQRDHRRRSARGARTHRGRGDGRHERCSPRRRHRPRVRRAGRLLLRGGPAVARWFFTGLGRSEPSVTSSCSSA
jgi:hypothetical protein